MDNILYQVCATRAISWAELNAGCNHFPQAMILAIQRVFSSKTKALVEIANCSYARGVGCYKKCRLVYLERLLK